MKNILSLALTLLLSLALPPGTEAQGSAGANAALEPRYLVDVPTAGVLPHTAIAFDMEFFQSDGLLAGFSFGLFNRVILGVSYGGTHIIGTETPSWNKHAGMAIKIRFLDETDVLPAIALGYSSQGKGAYIDSLQRYRIKSPGLYAAASKNYSLLGFFSIHGGINYSLERDDGSTGVNAFAGFEKSIGPFLAAVAEYDFGLNDSNNRALGEGKGYLNAGLRSSLGNGFTLGLYLKDIIQNQQNITFGERTLQIEYIARL